MVAQRVVMRPHAMTMTDGHRSRASTLCRARMLGTSNTYSCRGKRNICSVRWRLSKSQYFHGPLLSSSSSSASVEAHDCVSHVATLTYLTKVRQLTSAAIQCTTPRLKRDLNYPASKIYLVAVGNRRAASRAYRTAIVAERDHEQR